eukprot:352556-Chlamydomonas_euryale.AAC.3
MLRNARPTLVLLCTVSKDYPIVATAVGDPRMETYDDAECTRPLIEPVTLQNVLYAADASMDLRSTQCLSKAGGEVTISSMLTTMHLNGRAVYAPVEPKSPALLPPVLRHIDVGKTIVDEYVDRASPPRLLVHHHVFRCLSQRTSTSFGSASYPSDLGLGPGIWRAQLLHRASGLIEHSTLEKTLPAEAIVGAKTSAADLHTALHIPMPCEPCTMGKATRDSFKVTTHVANQP